MLFANYYNYHWVKDKPHFRLVTPSTGKEAKEDKPRLNQQLEDLLEASCIMCLYYFYTLTLRAPKKAS